MAFNALINAIAPIPTPPDWVRPPDWITITDTPNEVQFLVADTGAKAFTIRTTFTRTSGNIYIDWGDGTTDTISTITSTDTSHVYSTGGTPCSRGYNTFKIRIYGDATCVITNAQHQSNFSVTGGNSFYNIGLLEAYFGDGTCNTTALNSNYFRSYTTTAGQSTFALLEYVKLPATVTWNTNMANMFSGCNNLYTIVMPTSASTLTSMNSVFLNCTNLRDITLPSNATAITALGSTFSGCNNLRTISFPTTLNVCTTFSTIFANCYSLKNVTFPSINLVTDFTDAFSTCTSLQWFKFTSMPSPVSAGTSVILTRMFQNCYNLQNVFFPSTCSSNATYQMGSCFNGCYSLKNISFPTNFRSATLAGTFQTCYNLTSVTFPSPSPNLTDMTSCFSGCASLNSVTLPATVGSTITMVSAFNTCFSLSSITIPSAWNITSLTTAFNNCSNITSITLPNNAQNSLISMSSMCSGCNKLETIVMPTSMNLVNTLASAFNNCSRLTSVVFPATMNTVASISSCFNGCSSMTSVTLPTSMSACSNWGNTFQNCFILQSLTLPATISTAANYGGLAFSCNNLTTLILPTNQTTGATSISGMFTNCGSLTSITNLDKVGSLTATPLVNGALSTSGTGANALSSLSFYCPFISLGLNGTTTTTNFNKLTSLRLLNTSTGQWTGTSPQINVSYCDLSTAALNTLFADIAAQGTVVSKTINITSCTGAAGLTAANRLVLTSIGWTIIG